MRFSELEHSRVGILGFGREGRAVWRQIRRRYPDKPLAIFAESKAGESFTQAMDERVDEVHIGPFDAGILGGYDVLVRSAGISPYRNELQAVRQQGVKLTSATNIWFAENPSERIIGITGTLGKSTTAALTAHLLQLAGLDVCLAGNIGQPMLDIERSPDWWVIELSSYQLCDLEAALDIAVLLNLSEEHIDWHGDFERYRSDKLRLVKLAKEGEIVANHGDQNIGQALRQHPGVTWFNREGAWCADQDSVFRDAFTVTHGMEGGAGDSSSDPVRINATGSLPGQHNMSNLAAALTVMGLLDLGLKCVERALDSFTGLPHRLQSVGQRAGVRYVNDSISTTPASVAAALATVGHEGTVLLLGGLDRGLDWEPFAGDLKQVTPHAIVTMPDNGPKIMSGLERAGISPAGGLHAVESLEHAVSLAQQLAPPGGCILLSPGAPSFPHFRDFEDRGQRFKSLAGF